MTKTVPVTEILLAYEAGHRHFGESRLQEALSKIEALPRDCVWHFVGTLQSNKAKRVGGAFAVVHTIDREVQLKELAKAGRELDVLIEVNVGREQQKSGVLPEDVEAFAKTVLQYEDIRMRGLMGIGPLNPNAELMRPFFRELRALNERIGGQWLSMGMSNDFEVAIQEGSSHVRVGTALFGARN